MASEYEDMKNHPHYDQIHKSWWRFSHKGTLSEEWQDFRVYFEWAVNMGYEKGARIVRQDRSKPASPENCYLVYPEYRDVPKVKGGYKNIPCNSCKHDTINGCACYQSCKRYIMWFNKSWDDIRAAARILKTPKQ